MFRFHLIIDFEEFETLANLNTSYVSVPLKNYSSQVLKANNLNTSYVSVPPNDIVFIRKQDELFKYILCFGSTFDESIKARVNALFKYILCFGSTYTDKQILRGCKKFKYILCFGSTSAPLFSNSIHKHLNTSYVSVPHCC